MSSITQNGRLKRDDNDYPVMGGTSYVDNATIIDSAFDPVTRRLLVEGSGSSFSQFVLAATGTVNGSNTAFTFTSEPLYIVSDGAWYPITDNNGVAQWSWNAGTLTATMVIPPNSIIFGVM